MSDGAAAGRFATYREFFPFYLSEHRHPVSRRLHFFGTSVWLVGLATFLATFNPLFLAAGIVGAYGPAWVGHFFFERNRPATFRYPMWSAVGDHHMVWLALTGRLSHHLEEAERRYGSA
ncbi:MAG: DUF962 domain-containing protein [Caulobacterales bacterium]|nr:DUF962 domain-containing protein [Caulobacterales bacterium]